MPSRSRDWFRAWSEEWRIPRRTAYDWWRNFRIDTNREDLTPSAASDADQSAFFRWLSRGAAPGEKARRRAKRSAHERRKRREHANAGRPRSEDRAEAWEQEVEQQGTAIGKLAKVLAMLGSPHDHEVLAAAHRAEAMRKALGAEWIDLLADDKIAWLALRRLRARE